MKRLILAMLATFASYKPISAQAVFTVKSVKAIIQGTSNLHDWESDINKIECKGTFVSSGKILKAVKDVKVLIPVSGIKSHEGRLMDQKTHEAFKSDQFPDITGSFSLAKVVTDANQNVNITANGLLTMAGVTLPVSLSAKGKMLPNGDLQISFSKKLDMEKFNMKPPKAILGTIKVGAEVTVVFDLVLTSTKQAEVVKKDP